MPTPTTELDPKLKDYATETQARYLDAVNEQGSVRAAARTCGVRHSAVQSALDSLRKRAALQGYAPDHDMTKTVPAGFGVKGTSTLYRSDGSLAQQWVKTKRDEALAEEAVREFVGWLVEDARGLSPLIPAPAHANADLLALYGIGDPHFGLYTWAQETGADFDLDKAEKLTTAAIDRLVSVAPAAETALLLNAGDFFHADDSSNQTPASKHALDVDTRFAKVMQVGLRAMVHAIKRLLEKHKRVVVWMMPGNHDPHSSFALSLALSAFFSNEPRVEVDLSPSLYKYLRFGRVLIGAHHGHGAKMNDLPLVMATDRAQDWGATSFRYWYGGHIHHLTRKEWPGVVFETFRTLAAGDAWHAGKGYRAGRDMQLLIHHKDFGEIERHRCDVAMLEAA